MAKKLYYKIGEACKELDIQPYVLRYWETEFQALSPSKSKSGQRVYSAQDLELIRRIKELLYKEGYTIAGAKKKLEQEVVSKPVAVERLADEDDDDEGVEDVEASEEAADDVASEDVEESPPPAPKAVKQRLAEAPRKKPAKSSADAKVSRLEKVIRSALQEVKDILEILDRA